MANNKKFSSFLENPIDYTLLITVLLLLTIGLIMVLSASSPTSLAESGNSYKYFVKQGIFAVVGLIGMTFISNIDYRFYKKFYKIAYIIAIILLAAVLVVGKTINNAKRWIYVTESLSFQPSELVKFCMIIFYAGILTKNREELKYFIKGWGKHLIMLVPVIGLLIIEPHLSASVVIIGIVGIMMIIAGCKLWQIIVPGIGLGVPLAGIAILKVQKFAHAIKRITTFIDPWQDKLGAGYQVIQSLYAIGSGGLFGAGLGQSKQKYLYLPEPQNDFIFSVLAEELGFIGCTFVIILFAIFIWRGILIAMKSPDMFGSLVAVGITAMIGIQVIVNIAVVTSSMPATGMPLPFFSYGGTALVILLCQIGVLLNISRAGKRI
ncbi:MAG: putative lipid II flippase FtsW [Clostridia bacterium]|nr:putative lipid II flippase FtsW [Clostridia bacterium]